MNADEIVKALRILANGHCWGYGCKYCPADKFRIDTGACDDGTMLAAADMIERLQAEKAERENPKPLTLDEPKETTP